MWHPYLFVCIQFFKQLSSFDGDADIDRAFIVFAYVFEQVLFSTVRSTMRLVSLILSSMRSRICIVEIGTQPRKMQDVELLTGNTFVIEINLHFHSASDKV